MKKVSYVYLNDHSIRTLICKDEPMESAPVPTPPETDDSQPIDAHAKADVVPEPPITVLRGRRRGRRKVMKKKTIKDEEGYLGKAILHPLFT